jgi:hypothetical protein
MSNYIHKQTQADTLWSIEHLLHFKPNVSVFTDTTPPEQIVPTIDHTSTDHVNLTFPAPITGVAYLS